MKLYKLVTDRDDIITFYTPDLAIAGLVALAAWQGTSMLDPRARRSTLYGASPVDDRTDSTENNRVPIMMFSRFDEWWADNVSKDDDAPAVIEKRASELSACLGSITLGSIVARRAFEAEIDAIADQGDKLRFVREHPMRTDTLANTTTARCLDVALAIDQRVLHLSLIHI
jgi:hypothetical protein